MRIRPVIRFTPHKRDVIKQYGQLHDIADKVRPIASSQTGKMLQALHPIIEAILVNPVGGGLPTAITVAMGERDQAMQSVVEEFEILLRLGALNAPPMADRW